MDAVVWSIVLTAAIGVIMAVVLIWAMNSVQKERTRAAVDWGRKLLDAQEEERRGIARELHDGIVPGLESIGMELRKAGVEDGTNRASALAQQLRSLSRGLHPGTLDHLSLVGALEHLVASEEREGLVVTLDSDDLPELDFAHRLAGYRIVQEAINNARRHAAARHIEISIDASATAVDIRIHDDGKGFVVPTDNKLASLGLRSMRERASALGGTLTIASAPGEGTVIHAHLPLPKLA
ncbi:MAG: sensor histidine kinase [Gemmatimonadales bacterium]